MRHPEYGRGGGRAAVLCFDDPEIVSTDFVNFLHVSHSIAKR